MRKTYSFIMDAITFQYLISLTTLEGLDMYVMDIVMHIYMDI